MATHRISIFTCLAAAAFIFLHSSSPVTSHRRILLHHPLFPLDSSPSPNPTLPHAPPPPTPSSAVPLSSTPAASADPFFPTYPSLSPPPPDTSSSSAGAGGLPTFPANISSLVVPRARTSSSSSSSHSSTRTPKLIAIAVVLCLVAVSLLASFAFLRRRHISKKPPEHSQHTPHSSSAALFHRAGAGPGASTASSEFLYMGTRGLESPEIRPLPPLRPHSHRLPNSDEEEEEEEEEEFHSILSSSSSRRRGGVQTPKLASYAESSSSSPVPSVVLNSPSDDEISNSCSPHYILRPPPTTIIPPPPPPPPPPPVLPKPARSGFKSGEQKNMQLHRRGVSESRDGIGKPKLKGLHWDKVRATSDRLMVWDQLQSGSFALNEEMMETLFTVSTTSMGAKDLPRRTMAPMMNQEYRVLDPKKSQNIAILLRALNVTVEEVCDSLLEGNADMLGTELLESLLKMTPTEEEERKLREYKDESPLKLGPAEKFLKAVLAIPFAFKRVDAMLYIANFDSEVEYLGRSFEALEVACEELRNSRMFLKLLEAVLKTGNRMNVGTNRGDAEAFKLDTLLKLVDVKGADGKTTLLHFVVQEIIKAEGARLSDPEAGNSQTASSSLHDGMETRKQSLQIVASLCGELTNVKKAAAMDSDVVANDVLKLVKGVEKVEDIARLHVEAELPNKSQHMRFVDSMNVFLKRAGGEITRIQALESSSLSKVKELTEYFHGNSAKEEAHPLRIFMVVRDFLSVLDKVCKEVAKVNERTIISSNRQCGMPVNPSLPQLFPDHNNNEKQDEELPF